ncbi:uncharacterized protein K452DRAFT_50413 [Aplosporella prunicola CBS 121167]|uniref:Uncharacterized protein n=1 Tax=Aplosporella prunicola CBS 121167 TaxID=1176127 RepID=A0A6A6BBV5_9PEZI|nr:uncharacterized protein K452DRAFT_50413 [Aplosporella prunicola CBS 121167]KAF2140715.1 hypothetical protein K452DRAFT_50413 [Aplosporella prunicola CBS 121167]
MDQAGRSKEAGRRDLEKGRRYALAPRLKEVGNERLERRERLPQVKPPQDGQTGSSRSKRWCAPTGIAWFLRWRDNWRRNGVKSGAGGQDNEPERSCSALRQGWLQHQGCLVRHAHLACAMCMPAMRSGCRSEGSWRMNPRAGCLLLEAAAKSPLTALDHRCCHCLISTTPPRYAYPRHLPSRRAASTLPLTTTTGCHYLPLAKRRLSSCRQLRVCQPLSRDFCHHKLLPVESYPPT